MTTDELVGIVKQLIEEGGGGGGSVEKITLSAESGTLSNEDWTKLRASDGNILQIKVSDTNIRSFRYATSYGSYVYYVYVSENVDEQAEVEIIAINAGTLAYETRTLALGGGGVQYVDELPTTGSANTLYILSGGDKARNILKDRGTSGTKRYWKCRPGVAVSYDEDKNAYLATLGPEQFYIPLGLASMDLLVEQGAFSEVAETDPHDLVSYGSSSRAKVNNEQGLMLMPDMDKDNLPANTYLKATGTETITYDVDTNTFLRESGPWAYDLVYGTGMNNSILFLLRQSILEVVEDESEAELIVETNKLSAVNTTDSICVNVLGNVAFGGLYIYKDGAWVELIAPNDIELKGASGNAVQNRVINKIVREIKDTTYPYMTISYNTVDIDGYLIPVMEPYMFSDFLSIFDRAKCCILKCFEGTNAITLSILSTYKGNGIEEIYLDYPGVGIIKYYRSATEIENIHTSLIKYNDSPQTISITGTSGSLSDDQYLELQTTDAKILLADEDNIMLDKIKDSGTGFTYSAMIVNTSSALVGYSVVVNEDKSWTRYKKTVS